LLGFAKKVEIHELKLEDERFMRLRRQLEQAKVEWEPSSEAVEVRATYAKARSAVANTAWAAVEKARAEVDEFTSAYWGLKTDNKTVLDTVWAAREKALVEYENAWATYARVGPK